MLLFYQSISGFVQFIIYEYDELINVMYIGKFKSIHWTYSRYITILIKIRYLQPRIGGVIGFRVAFVSEVPVATAAITDAMQLAILLIGLFSSIESVRNNAGNHELQEKTIALVVGLHRSFQPCPYLIDDPLAVDSCSEVDDASLA